MQVGLQYIDAALKLATDNPSFMSQNCNICCWGMTTSIRPIVIMSCYEHVYSAAVGRFSHNATDDNNASFLSLAGALAQTSPAVRVDELPSTPVNSPPATPSSGKATATAPNAECDSA